MRQYAYGLLAATALTGGTVLFYLTSDPGGGVTGDDIVELQEGVNERWAAVYSSSHIAVGSNTFNFTVFTNIGGGPSMAQMKSVMTNIVTLAPYFVRTVSNGTPIAWTAPELFKAAGIGPADGTQALFTVGIQTNGTRIYSNAPALGVWTGLLWECYRGLTTMTTTAVTPYWLPGPVSNYNEQWRFFLNESAVTILKADGDVYPAWWTNPAPFDWQVSSNSDPSPDSDRMQGAWVRYAESVSNAAGPPQELITLTAPSSLMESRSTWGSDPNYWIYLPMGRGGDALANQSASVRCSSGGVRIAEMASGVVCNVEIPLSYTGQWHVVSYGVSDITLITAEAKTNYIEITFTNRPTTNSIFAFAGGYTYRLEDFAGPLSDYTAKGRWTTDWAYATAIFDHLGNPSMTGATSVDFIGPAILRWTFTRCRP